MSLLGQRLEGTRVRLMAAGDATYHVERSTDGAPVGRVELEERGDVLLVRTVCIEPAHRGFGAGSEAAALVREAAEADSRWVTLRATAPEGAGLAVYYWMRMGLRPIGATPGGGLLMEREL